MVNKILDACKEVYRAYLAEGKAQKEFDNNDYPTKDDYKKLNFATADLSNAQFRLYELAIKYGYESKFNKNTIYLIKSGATKHLKELGYWLDSYPENIDELTCNIIADHTKEKYPHYEVLLRQLNIKLGISPEFLEPTCLNI